MEIMLWQKFLNATNLNVMSSEIIDQSTNISLNLQ